MIEFVFINFGDCMQTKKLLVGFGISLIVFAITFPIVNITQASLLAIISLLVVFWTNEALPLAIVSLLPIVLFPALGILSTKATSINYANPIIYLFLGGFLLAIAVEKTKLHTFNADRKSTR